MSSIWNRNKAKTHLADQIISIYIDQTNAEQRQRITDERLKVLEDKVAKIERQNGK